MEKLMAAGGVHRVEGRRKVKGLGGGVFFNLFVINK